VPTFTLLSSYFVTLLLSVATFDHVPPTQRSMIWLVAFVPAVHVTVIFPASAFAVTELIAPGAAAAALT